MRAMSLALRLAAEKGVMGVPMCCVIHWNEDMCNLQGLRGCSSVTHVVSYIIVIILNFMSDIIMMVQ